MPGRASSIVAAMQKHAAMSPDGAKPEEETATGLDEPEEEHVGIAKDLHEAIGRGDHKAMAEALKAMHRLHSAGE